MNSRIKLQLFWLPEQEDKNYGELEKKVYEQTINEEWLTKMNPDYLRDVIRAFNAMDDENALASFSSSYKKEK
jgi:hypothetical protein